MYFVILFSSSWQFRLCCVIFSQYNQKFLDLLRSTPKCPVLLVLGGGCSGTVCVFIRSGLITGSDRTGLDQARNWPFKVIRLQRSGIDTIKYHT